MASKQVTCVDKTSKTHEGITHLGGAGWHWPAEKVITAIESREDTFFVLAGGRRAEVGVVKGERRKYLRTHADGQWSDNLLALPACSK